MNLANLLFTLEQKVENMIVSIYYSLFFNNYHNFCIDGVFSGDNRQYKALFYESNYIHFALVNELVSNVTYYYVCGDDVTQTKSKEYSFKMPNYESHQGSIALIGDLGQTSKRFSF
jgi:hypothetical protein